MTRKTGKTRKTATSGVPEENARAVTAETAVDSTVEREGAVSSTKAVRDLVRVSTRSAGLMTKINP